MAISLKNLELRHTDNFIPRHIGPNDAETAAMLGVLGYASLDELIDATIPAGIRTQRPLAIREGKGEYEVLRELKEIASHNQVFRSYIGVMSSRIQGGTRSTHRTRRRSHRDDSRRC